MKDLLVYVAGPLAGDLAGNLRNAAAAGLELIRNGVPALVPHLTAYLSETHAGGAILPTYDACGLPAETWYEIGLAEVRRCDAVLRLPGPSRGADLETWEAGRWGIPVFHAVADVLAWAASARRRPPLFQTGEFTLASGQKSKWKIECDALTAADWDGLAAIAAEALPPFGSVVGVPRGGLPFAIALAKYASPGARATLVAEDVVTSGGSINRFRNSLPEERACFCYGICVFARGPVPPWVTSLFAMPAAVLSRREKKAATLEHVAELRRLAEKTLAGVEEVRHLLTRGQAAGPIL